jgi:hypothetical protein
MWKKPPFAKSWPNSRSSSDPNVTWFSKPLHLVVVMFQTKAPCCVAVGRPIVAAAAFLRGVSRLKAGPQLH